MPTSAASRSRRPDVLRFPDAAAMEAFTPTLDGQLAETLDTDPPGQYAYRFGDVPGWRRLDRPADVLLVPEAGAPGSTLKRNTGDPEFEETTEALLTGSPIIVNDAGLYALFAQSIAGGRLGPNGEVRYRVESKLTNNMGGARNLTYTVSPGWTPYLEVTGSLVSGEEGMAILEGVIRNLNDELQQAVWSRLTINRGSSGLVDVKQQGYISEADTTDDWLLVVWGQLSAASLLYQLDVYAFSFEVVYRA